MQEIILQHFLPIFYCLKIYETYKIKMFHRLFTYYITNIYFINTERG